MNGEFVELLHRQRVLSPGGRHEVEDVLVLLELGGQIASDLAVLLESQILRAVFASKAVHEHFKLLPEIILNLVIITCQVMVSADVSDQNGIVDLDGRALLLKAVVGVDVIDDPGVIESDFLC